MPRNRTVLERHLFQYTARNTFDYFIHKDLGGFLRRELDFYIKNEIMHLDDVENEFAPRVEQYLSKIKVIRRIAGKIIDFLAQHPGSTAGDLAKGLNLNPGNVSTRLTQLAKAGEIKKASRGYRTK